MSLLELLRRPRPFRQFRSPSFLLDPSRLRPFSARSPDPESAIEEEPGDALFGLAEQFREQGNVEVRKSTLLYIVKRYPTSRFAARASQDLEALGVNVDDASTP